MLKKPGFLILFLLIFTPFINCSSEAPSLANSNSGSEATSPSPAENKTDSSHKLEKPKMHFEGTFLTGKKFDSYDYAGNKIIFAFFNYKNKNAVSLLKLLDELKEFENQKKFKLFAVNVNFNEKEAVQKFINDQKISLPIILENSSLQLAEKLDVKNEVSLVGLNNNHEISFSLKKYVDPGEEGREHLMNSLKEALNIENRFGTMPYLGIHPKAPNFKAQTIAGKSIELANFKGKVVLLFFFSPRCPHCQKEMLFLKNFVTPEIKKAGLEIITVSVLKVEGQNKTLIDQFTMPDWHIIDGSDRKIKDLYTQNTSIPEVFFIDRDGKIRFHDTGYAETYHANLNTMRFKKLLGLPNPPLLSDKTYNGVESCMICHEDEYVSWAVTPHAHAFETLEIKDEDFNPECVGCHSIGMNDPKGWRTRKTKNGEEIAVVQERFQNIQCEHCHGIGGAHMSTPPSEEELKNTCLECHTEKFSLHFDYHERIQKVNHHDKEKIWNLSPEEKLNLLKKVNKNPHQLFGSKLKYVGSDTCIKCHTDVHNNWKQSPHGKAFEALKRENKTNDPQCLQCHTVGLDQPGGYSLQNNKKPAFEGVGCESCHGPGEKHIASQRKSDIRSLGDDCPFCVVEQICLSCHDTQNDPHFNIYKGLEKIKGHK